MLGPCAGDDYTKAEEVILGFRDYDGANKAKAIEILTVYKTCRETELRDKVKWIPVGKRPDPQPNPVGSMED